MSFLDYLSRLFSSDCCNWTFNLKWWFSIRCLWSVILSLFSDSLNWNAIFSFRVKYLKWIKKYAIYLFHSFCWANSSSSSYFSYFLFFCFLFFHWIRFTNWSIALLYVIRNILEVSNVFNCWSRYVHVQNCFNLISL